MTFAHLAAAGVLDPGRLRRTVAGVLAIQRADGAIPWFHGDKLDPWDHVEAAMGLDAAGEHDAAARAYRWLAARQGADGSWHANYADDPALTWSVTDPTKDANFSAYPAVGIYHHYLATGDRGFLEEHWGTLRAAVEFVLGLQRPDGAIRWHPGTHDALLTGSSSIHQALGCALAAAAVLGEQQPDWELAAAALAQAVAGHPERFLPKDRYSMDWYYPVLGGVLRGAAARRRIDEGWDRFVVPGLGVRCVVPNPWVTGGESCELAIALWQAGRADGARALLEDVQHLRDEDGLYWTGYVYADEAVWPREKTAWTAAALLLALAVLGGDPATTAVFSPALGTGPDRVLHPDRASRAFSD
jgi:Prenyltransferase and squalene oxidase repeat